jgi:hypothetical protein
MKKSAKKRPVPTTIQPRVKASLRALGGRRIVVEGFGRSAPVLVAVSGGSDVPVGAWLSPREVRRLIDVARRILK